MNVGRILCIVMGIVAGSLFGIYNKKLDAIDRILESDYPHEVKRVGRANRKKYVRRMIIVAVSYVIFLIGFVAVEIIMR